MTKNIILLHGFTHNSKFFELLSAHLQKTTQNAKIHTLNFSGRGDAPTLNPRKYNYQTYVAELENYFITQNISSATILGTSMGGIVAMMFAEKHPQKIDNLILNDIGIFVESDQSKRVGRFVGKNLIHSNFESLKQRVNEEFFEYNLTPEELDFVAQSYSKKQNENYVLDYDKALANAFWRGENQIQIPDFDFSQIFKNFISNKNTNSKILVLKAEHSNFLSHDTIDKMLSISNDVSAQILKSAAHPVLFIRSRELEIVENFLK